MVNSDSDVANFLDFQDSTLLSFVFLTFDQTFRFKKPTETPMLMNVELRFFLFRRWTEKGTCLCRLYKDY